MGISATEIGSLLSRFGNQIVNDQVNFACPFVGNGHIQKIKHAHEQGIVRVRLSEGLDSTVQIVDGAQIPEGDNVGFTHGSYLPKIFFTRLFIPRGAAHLAAGGRDGVRLVREELDVAGRQLGKLLGKAVFDSPITLGVNVTLQALAVPAEVQAAFGAASITLTGGGATDVMWVTSIAGLYDGQFLKIRTGAGTSTNVQIVDINYTLNNDTDSDTALTNEVGPPASAGVEYGLYCIKVIKHSAGGATAGGVGINAAQEVAGNVADAAITVQTQDSTPAFAPPAGTANPLDPMVSLAQCASNNALYQMPTPPSAYTGNTSTISSQLTMSAMRDMSTKIKRRCGYGWHMLVMNSVNLQRYFQIGIVGAGDNFMNFLPGQTTQDADGGKVMPTFQGMPIVVDENVSDHDIFYFNKDDVKLAEFKDFAPDQDGGSGAHGMVDRTKLVYDTQIWGMYNMRVQRRNSMGLITGISQS
tara:strand:- start:4469 stop:5881 length:1413 start_codon:yes stop_codon:yes gene_type:complete